MNVLFHYGALGDFVLTLPLVRRLQGQTTLVTTWARGSIATKLVPGVKHADIQMWEFTRLHAEGGPTSVSPAVADLFAEAKTIISFISTGQDHWSSSVARLSPDAKIVYIDPRPNQDWDRHICDWHLTQASTQNLDLGPAILPDKINHTTGPIVIHPGSGALEKCWPVERFEALINKLREQGHEVRTLLGEAEAERWDDQLIQRWQTQYNASLFASVSDLYPAIAEARCFIGNDSGPTHLAAQAGVPTVALFGPTDPVRWAPVGPSVTLLAPDSPEPMEWLDVRAVLDACDQQG